MNKLQKKINQIKKELETKKEIRKEQREQKWEIFQAQTTKHMGDTHNFLGRQVLNAYLPNYYKVFNVTFKYVTIEDYNSNDEIFFSEVEVVDKIILNEKEIDLSKFTDNDDKINYLNSFFIEL